VNDFKSRKEKNARKKENIAVGTLGYEQTPKA